MKKITKVTLKKFLKENEGKLFIKTSNPYRAHDDAKLCQVDDEFIELRRMFIDERQYREAASKGKSAEELEKSIYDNTYTLGYGGIFLCGDNRDNFFTHYETEKLVGIHVDAGILNSSSFTIAKLKGE